MKFIGVDLGWKSGATGLCCIDWKNRQLEIAALTTKLEIKDILAWIDGSVPTNGNGLVAVDAPTLIPNQTGMRVPDKLTHHHFGRYHAGCYPANLNRPFAQRTVEFGLSLEKRGFNHAPEIEPGKEGRYQIEVFPHPAMIYLFGLERILKYKRGKIAQRKAELLKLYNYILTVLPKLEPRIHLSNFKIALADINEAKGTKLKSIEDQLDSLICAYVGAYWWYWGEKRNLVLGNKNTGYIVVPKPI